jgi:hypothetical protein
MAIEWLAGNRLRGTTAERPNLGLPYGSVGGWKELGRTSNSSLPDVTGLADKQYLMFLNFQESNNSRPVVSMRFNGDSGSNYALRGNANAGSDYSSTGITSLQTIGGQPQGDTTTVPYLSVGYIANLAGKEKLINCHNTLSYQLGAGSSEPLERKEFFGKWANTSEAVDQLTILTTAGGSFNTNGELIVLGWDSDDTHTDNFWEELASGDETSVTSSSTGTITAKKYLWIQVYLEPSSSTRLDINFNNDTGSNYARRGASNGGSNYTSPSQSQLAVAGTDASPKFVNMFFLNNSSQEKLGIAHSVNQNTAGAGNAPARQENVLKWDNTSSQITEIDFVQGDGASMDRIIWKVWGSD